MQLDETHKVENRDREIGLYKDPPYTVPTNSAFRWYTDPFLPLLYPSPWSKPLSQSPWTTMAAFELSAPALGPLLSTLHTTVRKDDVNKVRSVRVLHSSAQNPSSEVPKSLRKKVQSTFLSTAYKALREQVCHFLPLSLVTCWLPCCFRLCPTCFYSRSLFLLSPLLWGALLPSTHST